MQLTGKQMACSNPPVLKRKRNLPGTPDPEAEVIALSPKTLLATNRFLCEICGKGFQRDQNLQLHRRGHNLPWKLRQRSGKEQQRKRVYVCPEKSCVHHNPTRALGDLTGIKKHFCRKHCEKKWKCEKCSKKYAVQADWKAHSKTCGTREYRCDCGTVFARRDSFITHRAFCDALAEEITRASSSSFSAPPMADTINYNFTEEFMMRSQMVQHMNNNMFQLAPVSSQYTSFTVPSLFSNQQQHCPPPPVPAGMSATALLQKAALVGVAPASNSFPGGVVKDCHVSDGNFDGATRDFLGVGVQTLCTSSINGWI